MRAVPPSPSGLHCLALLVASSLTFAIAPPAAAQCLEGCLVIHELFGEAAGDQFGWEARRLGDLTGDGILDFAVTAPTNDGGGNNAGRVYVYNGDTGLEMYRVSGLSGWQLGFNIAACGDLSGDGITDFIAGAPFVGAGRARIYNGANGVLMQTLNGVVAGDQFGYRVAGGKDATGDGVPDLLVGAINHDAGGSNAGRVYLYSGADYSLVCTVDGVTSSDNLGSSLAFTDDLNGDGRSEFVAGAQNAGLLSNGLAYLYSFSGLGCSMLHTFVPPGGASAFGQFFIGGGHDIDADGTPDIYVSDFNANRAHVYSGDDFSQIWMLTGDGNGGFGLGEMVDDVDGDGHDDLALAAWVSNAGGSQAGKCFIYSGQTGMILETFTHDVPGATFGFDINGLKDVDGDGKTDYLITAAWDLAQRGKTYVIAGTIGPEILCPADCAGAGDGTVDISDLLALLAAWGTAGGCDIAPDPTDGVIDVQDLLALLASWGPCS